ncbi:Amino acid transporter [Macleaya cordata]|uniref:Amino acid transporter n=1 Tax=Macleaya cordata TaxID=56857 RepID=A0A200QEV9_MACCD|nr:Amino acid transporter [Macleaya cordata]
MEGVEHRNVNITSSSSITTPLAPLNHEDADHDQLNSTTMVVDEEAVADHYHQNNFKEGTSTFFKTCFNGFNALSGVGILTVPYALASGGWLSLILLLIVASASFYTGLLIRRCMDKNSKIKTYTDIGEQAFGSKGRTVVSILMFIDLYLVATGFLIVEGDNLSNLFPNMGFELGGIRIHGRQGFVIIVALIILPTMWLNDLSKLSYVSATGVFAAALIIGCVLWVGAVDGIGFHEKGTLFNLKGIPNTVNLFVFCYCAHPVIPTLYTSMKDKRQFSKVLLVCFVLCTISYGSMAVLGYLMYGDNVKSQVTLNLPTENVSSKIAIYTILITPIAKYALMFVGLDDTANIMLLKDYGNVSKMGVRAGGYYRDYVNGYYSCSCRDGPLLGPPLDDPGWMQDSYKDFDDLTDPLIH